MPDSVNRCTKCYKIMEIWLLSSVMMNINPRINFSHIEIWIDHWIIQLTNDKHWIIVEFGQTWSSIKNIQEYCTHIKYGMCSA